VPITRGVQTVFFWGNVQTGLETDKHDFRKSFTIMILPKTNIATRTIMI